MAEERLGASFSIDVTDLKTGLATANRLIKESQSEFKAAAAGMDDWTKSQDGLTAKIKSLNDITELQRKKVDALQSEYDNLIAGGLDPASKAAVDLRTKINNEKAALAANEKELQKQQQALADMENASDDAADAADDAADAIKDTGDAAKDSGDGFTIAKGAIADLISNGLQNLVGACKDAISSIAGLASETRESRAAFAKLENSFDTAGFSAETAEKTMRDLYGVLGDADKANEASSLIAKMSNNQKDLEANTRILTGVYAEYGDSIPTEGLAEGMAATAAMGQVQGVLADALEWQGINLDDYNEKLQSMSTEEERAAYIQETLTDLYGDSADKFRENNGALIEANEAQLDYNRGLDALGGKIEPITTKVREGFNKILEKALELVEDVDFEKLGDKIEKGFETFIEDVLPKIEDGFQWIIDNKDIIIAGLAGIAAGFAAFKVVSIIQGVTKAMEGMSLAQAALNLVMSLNPIGLVVAAIAGLVAAFVVLWKKCDGFREFWLDLWEIIKKGAADAWEWIKKVFSEVGEFFVKCWQSIVNAFSGAVDWFGDIFSRAWTAIKNAFSSVRTFFSDAWNSVKSAFQNTASWFGEIFKNAWKNIKDAFASVGEFFGGIWDTIKQKFTDIGQKIGESVGGAFKTAINAVLSAAERVLNSPINAINNMLDNLGIDSIGRLSTFSLPRMAKGGVVDQATAAVIGEAGAEAVVPLENNTEWLDKLADRLVDKLGGAKGGVVVNQTNNFAASHTRLELYKAKQQTAAAVRIAQGGAAFV